jgi:hypothetical protein
MKKEGMNHETIYTHCYYRVLAYWFYASYPVTFCLGIYHKWYDCPCLVKFAWLYDFFRACIDAMSGISEESTTSVFMLPSKVEQKDNFLNNALFLRGIIVLSINKKLRFPVLITKTPSWLKDNGEKACETREIMGDK